MKDYKILSSGTWTTEDKISFNVLIQNDDAGGEQYYFHCCQSDFATKHTQEIWNRIVIDKEWGEVNNPF